MAAAVYPSALDQFLQAGINLASVDAKIVAVTSGYVYSAAHDFLDDVGGGFRLGTPESLTAKTFTSGLFSAAAMTYTGVALAAVIAGFVGYVNTGVEATSRLVWFEDRNADGSPIAFTGTGAGIPVSWPNGIFSI